MTLPTGWIKVPLASICRVVEGQVDPRDPEYRDLPHINGEVIESGTGRLLDVRTAAEDGLISGKYLFEPGMVLYSKLRPYLRKVTIAPSRGVCSADMYPLTFDPLKVDTRFAMFSLLAEPFTRYAIEESRRARMPKLNRAQLLAWDMPLPQSVEVQQRIAAEVAERLAVADAAKRVAEERLAAAEALSDAYLREVFDGPEALAWPRRSIASLGDPTYADVVQTGPFGAQLPSSEFTSEGVPVLNIGNVKDGRLNLDRLDHVSPGKADELARYRLRAGDMLFTRSGSVGRSAVVDATCEGWLISYHLLRVSFDLNRIEPGFVSAAIRGDSAVLVQVRKAAGRGATRDGINASILADLVVPTPSLDTQRAVLCEIDRRFNETRALVTVCEEALAALAAIPAALLRTAFNGEA